MIIVSLCRKCKTTEENVPLQSSTKNFLIIGLKSLAKSLDKLSFKLCKLLTATLENTEKRLQTSKLTTKNYR
jgi:hypothetical protein